MFEDSLSTLSSGSRLKERPVKHVMLADENGLSKYFTLGAVIGQGAYGVVMEATDVATGAKWAIKKIEKVQQSCRQHMALIERELSILKVVKHPHIIHLDRVFESHTTLFLVLELCIGELAKLFEEKKRFAEEEARCILCRLCSAVVYLHSNGIVHRDLKLENILLSINPDNSNDRLFIKVTDFGLSVVKDGMGWETMLQELCGTLAYMAPEVISAKSYSQQCDVWSMGVILYLMLSGHLPFDCADEARLAKMIKHDDPPFPDDPWENISWDVKMLIRKMLTKNPAYRITAVEVRDSEWVTGVKAMASHGNILEMMQQWTQNLRLPVDGNYDEEGDYSPFSIGPDEEILWEEEEDLEVKDLVEMSQDSAQQLRQQLRPSDSKQHYIDRQRQLQAVEGADVSVQNHRLRRSRAKLSSFVESNSRISTERLAKPASAKLSRHDAPNTPITKYAAPLAPPDVVANPTKRRLLQKPKVMPTSRASDRSPAFTSRLTRAPSGQPVAEARRKAGSSKTSNKPRPGDHGRM